jgi:hypothetical protein
MYIKNQTVIPVGTKITKCAPSEGKGKSIYTLLRIEEKKLEKQTELKAKADKLASLLKTGHSVKSALEIVSKD